jgi:RNA polymerase sigma-70 factor, ECF subfamily
LSVEQTATVLQISKGTVKTRLLRACRRLQQELDPELRDALHGAFPFAGADCDRLAERVLAKFLPS